MKLKGIVLAVILLLASIMMPFDIYADSPQIIGKNFTLVESTYQNTESITVGGNTSDYNFYRYTYEIEYYLDDYYIGYIEGYFKYYYSYMPTTGSSTTLNNTRNLNVYCNSDSFKFTISFTSDLYDPLNYTSSYLTTTSLNLTKISDLDSIEQIIDILNDLYTNSNDIEGLSTNQLAELETIVSNTSLSNDYLELISEIRQFDIPFESISFVSALLTRYSNKLSFFYGDNHVYVNYPVFKLDFGDYIAVRGDLKEQFVLIFGINLDIPNKSSFINNLVYNNSITSSDIIEYYHLQYINVTGVGNINIYKVVFNRSNNPILRVMNNNGFYFMPIYFNYTNNNISTEFALRWGLSNSLLDNIQIIANGTSQSNQAASNLESSNDQMADDMNDLATIENGYNQQFNNQLQQIDFSSPLQSNAGILPAANFVITIFNGLINNNPFSVLIIIVCILLIGKKVIGK